MNVKLRNYLKQAVAQHQAGDIASAEVAYREILRKEPRQQDALHLLGMVLHQKGDLDAALRLIDRSLQIDPKLRSALITRGTVLKTLGRHDAALASLDRAIALDPHNAVALNNRGSVLHDLSRFAEALVSYQRAIGVQPVYAEAVINRANTLSMMGRHEEALKDYSLGLSLRPDNVSGHLNKALCLVSLGRPEQALTSFDRAIALEPDHDEAFYKRGLSLHLVGRYVAAVESYNRSIAINPGRVEVWNDLGVTATKIPDYTMAVSSFHQALKIHPDFSESLVNLAAVYSLEGRQLDAIACLNRLLILDATAPQARVLRAIYSLPIIYRDESDIAAARSEYGNQLETLRRDLEETGDFDRFVNVIGSATPFYLPYQGLNDLDLQRAYGELACRVSESCFKTPDLPWPVAAERIRVGIVSPFFRRHTVWHLILKGWVSKFDRSRFEVYGYHTGAFRDSCTEFAHASCDHFVQGPLTLKEWRTTILKSAPHVLLFPEVGMDTLGSQLAAQRLARVQCNSWGHPETSGFPTLDYFLSSDAMEPPTVQATYTEQLVRLPNLGIFYEPAAKEDILISREELGLRSTAMVFWCCQSLYKYLPQYDDVFPRIAREVPNAQFAFIEYPYGTAVSAIFRERLSVAFRRFDLDFEAFCIFMPTFQPSRFAAAFAVCDVILDSIGWSGGQTTLESLPHNRPIVSMTSRLMRGNHTAAILKLMDLDELVATTLDEYVAIAARLGLDSAWRTSISQRIAASQGRLYRDQSVIDALESFLEDASRLPQDGASQRPQTAPL